jgi:exodeoxyribonuclease VII small subunit
MSKSFEENLENLENLVKELETGDIPLEDAIEKYTEAMKLIKECDETLNKSKEKIAKISENGELKDFEP